MTVRTTVRTTATEAGFVFLRVRVAECMTQSVCSIGTFSPPNMIVPTEAAFSSGVLARALVGIMMTTRVGHQHSKVFACRLSRLTDSFSLRRLFALARNSWYMMDF